MGFTKKRKEIEKVACTRCLDMFKVNNIKKHVNQEFKCHMKCATCFTSFDDDKKYEQHKIIYKDISCVDKAPKVIQETRKLCDVCYRHISITFWNRHFKKHVIGDETHVKKLMSKSKKKHDQNLMKACTYCQKIMLKSNLNYHMKKNHNYKSKNMTSYDDYSAKMEETYLLLKASRLSKEKFLRMHKEQEKKLKKTLNRFRRINKRMVKKVENPKIVVNDDKYLEESTKIVDALWKKHGAVNYDVENEFIKKINFIESNEEHKKVPLIIDNSARPVVDSLTKYRELIVCDEAFDYFQL